MINEGVKDSYWNCSLFIVSDIFIRLAWLRERKVEILKTTCDTMMVPKLLCRIQTEKDRNYMPIQ